MARRTRAKEPRRCMLADFPESILLEVLRRVPLKGYLLVCQKWAQLSTEAQVSLRLDQRSSALASNRSLTPQSLATLQQLVNLTSLDVRLCHVDSLLKAIAGHLPRLQHLKLRSRYSSPSTLLAFLQGRTCLKTLDFEVPSVPESISSLVSLERLSVQTAPCDIPEAVSSLQKLRVLTLGRAYHFSSGASPALIVLPSTLSQISSLTELRLTRGLHEFPHNVRALAYLRKLSLESFFLDAIPPAVFDVHWLQELELKMSHLQSFDGRWEKFICLQVFKAASCRKGAALPDSFYEAGKSLRRLELTCASFSEKLSSLSNLEALSIAELCGSKVPESLCSLARLRNLRLRRYDRWLPEDLGDLMKLQSLTLVECSSFVYFPPTFRLLTDLRCLHVELCHSLRSLPRDIGLLQHLQEVTVKGCFSFKVVPASLGDITSLRSLTLWKLLSLASIPDSLTKLSLLGRLTIYCCPELSHFQQARVS